MSRTSAKAKNRYATKTYDRIVCIVKKGRKAEIQRRAELLGLSVNAYICGLIDRDTAGLNLSAAEQNGGE